jgi:ABC-type transport system substrate-binding protein
MSVISFRGQIANDSKETIALHTNNGSVGYKIVKYEIMPKQPEGATEEATMQIFSTDSSATAALGSGTIDFSDPTLLGAAFYSSSATAATNPEDKTVIFDNVTFNQDIYLTCKSSANMNYHIELEKMKLDLNENTVATLKDIRNTVGQ